nr:ATP-binding protein [Pseudomonas sp. Irchel 3A18]
MAEVIEQLFTFIRRNTPSRARFSNDRTQREDIPLYPEVAIREGIVNAFAHRDYSSFSGGIKVEISPAQVKIWNSGTLPEGVSADQLQHGHISVLRNPDIAHILYLLGYMEKLGRGSVLICQACESVSHLFLHFKSGSIAIVIKFFIITISDKNFYTCGCERLSVTRVIRCS